MRAFLAAVVVLASIASMPVPAAAQTLPNAMKICSPVAPGSWRATTPVQTAWTVTDCQAYGRSVGATAVQLGCVFAAPTPSGQRFSWGPRNLSVTGAPTATNLPANNCGWAV